MVVQPKKSLGQHWLKDQLTLEAICASADLKETDTVLEVGPGQGDLTAQLVKRAGRVIAVELDEQLAASLPKLINVPNLEVISADILKFDLTQLPADYKLVANIPYYLTSHLIRSFSESPNPPQAMVLLVQKEVAERIAAQPGQMSLLSASAQLYYQPTLGQVVPAELFEPPPKVDSQVIILKRRPKSLFKGLDTKLYFQIVKAGFAGRRKKLRSSLAAGLSIDKKSADELLKSAGISGDLRAQNLSLPDWHKLYLAWQN
ncbi:16S rRNA (adenine(1518)-N(6)/adenine(1519)-N(6))-dimethyltransferase RsmA [Candidatus Saccharibacteria bacterium]|nr:16S rRNA (adenine(1518)-N(6)/adenine(1519)-N(6))-dimethyltransferase RsmA [Candidatus Saccharibacteria bacterium]